MTKDLGTKYAKTPEWVLCHPQLSDGAKVMYGLLARYGQDSYPSVKTLAEKCGKGVVQARRLLHQLEDAGVVEISARTVERGRQTTNVYTLVWDPPKPGVALKNERGVLPGVMPTLPIKNERVPPLINERPRKKEEKNERKTFPAAGGGRASQTPQPPPKGEDMPLKSDEFGGDPDKKPKQPRRGKPSAVVINHMQASFPAVVTAFPAYRNAKVADHIAFASYLNSNFFGSKAKTPMSVEQVTGMVDAFLRDLRYGVFDLKDGQPVWMAFTRRWQNYADTPVTPEGEKLRATYHRGSLS